jgi:hypothetical protein
VRACPWSAVPVVYRVVVFQCGLPGMAWSLIPFGSVVGRWWSAGVPGFGGWLWVVGWLWVENCIVDASILFSVVFCVCG